MTLARYSKAIAALFAGVGTWWGSILGGSPAITAGEWRQLYLLVGGAFLVYLVPNDTTSRAPKIKRDKTTPDPEPVA